MPITPEMVGQFRTRFPQTYQLITSAMEGMLRNGATDEQIAPQLSRALSVIAPAEKELKSGEPEMGMMRQLPSRMAMMETENVPRRGAY